MSDDKTICPYYYLLQYGSSTKFPGSGGAVIGLCNDPQKLVSINDGAIRQYCHFTWTQTAKQTTNTLQAADMSRQHINNFTKG